MFGNELAEEALVMSKVEGVRTAVHITLGRGILMKASAGERDELSHYLR